MPSDSAEPTDADRPASGPPDAAAPLTYRFRLFVAGAGPLSVRVRENFARHVSGPLGGRAAVEVVDLAEDPRLARTHGIIATPTLVRLEPAPVVRLVGDLTDFDRVRSLVLAGAARPGRAPAPRRPAVERRGVVAGECRRPPRVRQRRVR